MHYDTLALQQRVLLLAACAHANRHRYKNILKEACTLLYILQLAVAYHSDRRLDCSWPLTCSLCSVRSDFILGNMRWALERVHGWGKEALHTVELHICVWPWAFSPSQLSAPSLPEAPSLGFQLSSPGLVHSSQVQCLGGPPPASMQSTQTVGSKRPPKNASRAFEPKKHIVSVDDGGTDVRLTCRWPMKLSKHRLLQSPKSQEKMPQ